MANKNIIDKVFKKLMDMSGDELICALDKHSNGDIAAALEELNTFDVGFVENKSIITLENKSSEDVKIQGSPFSILSEPIYKISTENLNYIINFKLEIPLNSIGGSTGTIIFNNSEENLKLSESKSTEQSCITWTTQKDSKWAA